MRCWLLVCFTACAAQNPTIATSQTLQSTLLPATDSRSVLTTALANATQAIEVGEYLLSDDAMIAALRSAAKRGVEVRVIIDSSSATASANAEAMASLGKAGVVFTLASGFAFHHAKYLIVDHRVAFVMTCNWTYSAFTHNREVIVRVDDAQSVTDLDTIFASDLTHDTPAIAGTALVVSPANSRAKIVGLLTGAANDVWIGVEEISDRSVIATLIALAANGIAVHVLVPDPAAFDNADAVLRLTAATIEVRALSSLYVHEKVIVADNVAFVGSENLSETSLDHNREVGVISGGTFADAMRAQLQADWANATAL